MKHKHPLNFFLILLTALAFVVSSRAQAPAWQQSSEWTLYNVHGAKFYKIAQDSLDKYNKRSLNDDSMRAFLTHSSVMPSEKAPMWMGAYVASCTIDHRRRKIDISSYGGFFFDEAEKKYYSVPQEMQKEWLNYLAECAGSIPSQK